MAKVRILFTIPNFITAGSGREMFNIIERLDREIFEPFIAVKQVGGAVYDEILQKGYPVITGPFCVEESKSTLRKLIAAFMLAKKFKPYKFGIWQSFNWSSDYTEALVAKFSGARYVYVKKNMNWDRLAWKVKSHLSNAIVARNSNLIKGTLSTKALQRKTFFVPGGVFGEFGMKRGDDFRECLNIPRGAILISCVAQIVRVKDQVTLIKAVSSIEGCYLVLAGAERDIEYASQLRALIADANLEKRVYLIGSLDNVGELLKASDIFVLPTTNQGGHEEGCPVALLEAMAAGVPCIASDVSGNRDLIWSHKTGLLFTPGKPEELAACINYYIANPVTAQELADNALMLVKTQHTLDREAADFSNMYREILRR